MDAIAEIKGQLARYPELSYCETESSIEVAPQSPDGFCVGLSVDESEYTVHFDGWHDHFDSRDDALDWFAMGVVSGICRVAVTYRARTAVSFALELLDGERWVPHSTTGLIFRPYWGSKRTVYLRNPVRTRA